MTRRHGRITSSLVAATVVMSMVGCTADAPSVPMYVEPRVPVTESAGIPEVLTALGADRVYLMAGDDVLRAGLGLMDDDVFRPAELDPSPTLVSNLSGNGTHVVLGAAGVGAEEFGFLVDGVYLLDGERLVTLAEPGADQLAPTIAADGTIMAISRRGGFWRLSPGRTTWERDKRLRGTGTGAVAQTARGGFAVTQRGTPRARLVHLTEDGRTRDLGTARCARGVEAAPNGARLVTMTGTRRKPHPEPDCNREHVIDRDGHVTQVVPQGWQTLAWSADSSGLLLSRGTEVAVWSLEGRFEASADLGVDTFAAAPVYSR